MDQERSEETTTRAKQNVSLRERLRDAHRQVTVIAGYRVNSRGGVFAREMTH